MLPLPVSSELPYLQTIWLKLLYGLTPQGPTCDLCILNVPWNISNGCCASLLNHTALKQKLCWPRCRWLSEMNWQSDFLESITEATRHQRRGFHYIAAVVFHKKCKQRLPNFVLGLTQFFLGVIYGCYVSSQLNSTHYLGEGWVEGSHGCWRASNPSSHGCLASIWPQKWKPLKPHFTQPRKYINLLWR